MDLRLKSPSFTFFDSFQNEFSSLVTGVLQLNESQVHIGQFEWQPGPRLHMLVYLFPVNATFDPTEYERLFKIVANWELSAGSEWSLSVIGPYELLNFSECKHSATLSCTVKTGIWVNLGDFGALS